MRTKIRVFLSLALLTMAMDSRLSFAQPPGSPADLDEFLEDDEEFDSPPPKPFIPPAPVPPPSNSFNPPPPTSGGFGSSGSSSSSKPRVDDVKKQRKGPPSLLTSQKSKLKETGLDDITDEKFPDLLPSFDYPDAEIADIVKAMAELTGKNFIVESGVRGKITIIGPTPITVAEAYRAFLSALAVNGYTVVQSGKFLKVLPIASAKGGLDTYVGDFAPSTDVMITRIVQLKHISAKEIFNQLSTILKSSRGELRVYEPTNTLIISDYGSNIDRAIKVIQQLDIQGFEDQVEVIRIRYAAAQELAKLLDQIINKGKQGSRSGPGFQTGVPRFSPLGAPQSESNEAFSLVIPDERTNSLIVVGNKQGIEKIRTLVRKLDYKLDPETQGGVYVYYVRFGDAEKIATTLQGVAQGINNQKSGGSATRPGAPPGGFGGPPQPTEGLFSDNVKIASDKNTNSIIVTASKQDYQTVQGILAKLDIPKDQVYVEGIIMEMQVQDTKNWSVKYYNLVGDSFAGRAGFSGSPGISDVIDPTNDKGAILGFGAGGKVKVTIPGGTSQVEVPSLLGFIKLLSEHKTINILSTPQVIAMDNEKATIEVGDKVPVGSSTQTTGSSVTTSTDRQDVSTKLEITPHISPGSQSLRLEIELNIEDVNQALTINATNLAANAIATSKRNTKTNVLIRNGDTVVLGGLIKDRDNVTVVKVPILGDIPILGWLFKSRTVEKSKSNLMIFLTPKIIASRVEQATLLKEKLSERVNYIQRNLGGQDSKGELVDQLKLIENKSVKNDEEIK